MTTDALGMLLGTLAVLLTIVMFIARESMLGFPCTIFWAILGGFSYTQSAATWDIHYLLFFGSMGMTIFSAISAYGLREKRDSIGDESMDEEPSEEEDSFIDEEEGKGAKPSRRTQKLRDRAEKRRTRFGDLE